MDTLTAHPSTAAAARRHRARAAGLLADSPLRAQFSWIDLCAVPPWATWERDRLDRLACASGTHAHAASLRHCIDGRILLRLRERLGDAALTALLDHESAVGAAPLLQPMDLDAESLERLADSTGRDWLLASIAHGLLRDALRERLWADAGPVLRAINTEAAAQVVHIALHACALDAQTPARVNGPAA